MSNDLADSQQGVFYGAFGREVSAFQQPTDEKFPLAGIHRLRTASRDGIRSWAAGAANAGWTKCPSVITLPLGYFRAQTIMNPNRDIAMVHPVQSVNSH